MDNWMEGYISDVEYTAKYYKELSPDSLNISTALANIEPIATDQPFTYCELGCGQGMTSLVLAASYPHGTFYAVDYSPSHISHAKRFAQKANLNNIHFLEKSFQELVTDKELLPELDYMVFHGVYTWVSDENRAHLVQLCQNHVKPGGLVYNSYNAKPGWSINESMQKLILGLSQEYTGSSLTRIESAINALEKIKKINTGYFAENKESINALLKGMKKDDKLYTVHEYLNDYWRAFYFPEVADEMAKAKLNYLCSATPADAYMQVLLSEDTQKELNNLHSQNNRELLKDLMVNTGFRKDIYVRGSHNRTNFHQQYAWFEKLQWLLLRTDKKKELKVKMSGVEISIDENNYATIINHLNNVILSTEELQIKTGIPHKTLIYTLILLYSSGLIGLYKEEEVKGARALNRIISSTAFDTNTPTVITFPHIHTGKTMDAIGMAWLDGIYNGLNTTEALVNYAYEGLSSRGMTLTYNGKTLSGEPMKKRLYALESVWREKTLPLWIKLGIVDLP